MADKWTKIGNVVKKFDKEGNHIGYFFAFADGIEVAINGKTIDTKFLNVEKPIDKYKRFVSSGKMTEEEFEDKQAALANGKVALELTLAPSK